MVRLFKAASADRFILDHHELYEVAFDICMGHLYYFRVGPKYKYDHDDATIQLTPSQIPVLEGLMDTWLMVVSYTFSRSSYYWKKRHFRYLQSRWNLVDLVRTDPTLWRINATA